MVLLLMRQIDLSLTYMFNALKGKKKFDQYFFQWWYKTSHMWSFKTLITNQHNGLYTTYIINHARWQPKMGQFGHPHKKKHLPHIQNNTS